MAYKHSIGSRWIDANGRPTECVLIGGQEVVVHYEDIPESDITTVDGLRVTTPLRTVIDIAVEIDSEQLELVIQQCLDRNLFTVEEALARIAEPGMRSRAGGQRLGRFLNR